MVARRRGRASQRTAVLVSRASVMFLLRSVVRTVEANGRIEITHHSRGRYSETPHSFTGWSRVLQKLAGPQLVKKLPASYGTRMFVTAFTRAHHSDPTLSQINPVHVPPQPIPVKIHFNIIPQLSLGLPSGPSPVPHTFHMPRPSHSS